MDLQNVTTALFDESPIDEDFLLYSGFSPNRSTNTWSIDIKKMHRISIMFSTDESVVYLHGVDRHGMLKTNDLLDRGGITRGRVNQLLLAFELLDLSRVAGEAT